MSAKVVAQEEALQAGADIWIVPDLENSEWTQRIDWYLNFQIFRSETHLTPKASAELEQVLAEWDIDAPGVSQAKTSPLMIASSDRLPNHAVVVVPFVGGEIKSWAEKVHETWSRLDAPRLRVFLPSGLTAARFSDAWPGPDEALSLALVPET